MADSTIRQRHSETGFQSRSSRIGEAFELECIDLLGRLGFHNIERRPKYPEVGIEIDLSALTADGFEVLFECKATNAESKRPGGMQDTDNVKKSVADAFLLTMVKNSPPYIVLTTHTPTSGRALAMVQSALDAGAFLAVVDIHNDASGIDTLRSLAQDAQSFFYGGRHPC